MADDHHSDCRLARILAAARFEIIPLGRVVERVPEAIPAGATVTVTCSPQHGVLRTVEAAEFLAARGYEVVPHLAASEITDGRRLAEVARRLSASGVSEVFVIGGDGQSGTGRYSSAAEVIEDLVNLPERPRRIGVAGYPEGHPKIPGDLLVEALGRKAQHAAYVVPQMCFDPATMRTWIETVSDTHPGLEVVLSAPGAVTRRKLLEISPKIGVGNSLRYLSKNRRAMSRLLLHRTFTPDSFLRDVMAGGSASSRVTGLHLFTFNQLGETEQWRADRHAKWRRSARSSAADRVGEEAPCCVISD